VSRLAINFQTVALKIFDLSGQGCLSFGYRGTQGSELPDLVVKVFLWRACSKNPGLLREIALLGHGRGQYVDRSAVVSFHSSRQILNTQVVPNRCTPEETAECGALPGAYSDSWLVRPFVAECIGCRRLLNSIVSVLRLTVLYSITALTSSALNEYKSQV
jgi:hypothetical protein